jgi:UDP-N-acetylglucosamine 2-epimerase
VLNIGDRQRGRRRGRNVTDVGTTEDEIYDKLSEIVGSKVERDEIYGNGDSAKKIADALAKCELRIDKKITY